MVTVAIAVQLLASVTVTVYIPAVNPVAVAEVCCMGMVFNKKVKPPVPPALVTVAVPSFPPLQVTLVELVMVAVIEEDSVIVTLSIAVQPLPSVAVTV